MGAAAFTIAEQQIIPNMQEPIISEELFDRVQELRSHKRRNTKTGRASLFAGLLFCPDCGAKLHFCAAKSLKPNQEFYRCANYNSGRGTCNIHYIRNVVLEQIVAEAVGSLADFVRCYEPIFLYLLAKNNTAARQPEVQKLKQVITTSERRIEVHSKDKKTKKVKVDIYFTAVGLFSIPTEKEMQTAMEEIRQNPQQFKFSA